mmetsp:Transcript_63194/g.105131  ORF Transcript_63194/g.105131 Transcript_63194/m.105131 type:complete len:244 (-) Transcript_63194:390-1121(-)
MPRRTIATPRLGPESASKEDRIKEKEYIRLLEKSTKVGAHKAVQILRRAIALMPEREEAYHNLVQEISTFGPDVRGKCTAAMLKLLTMQTTGTEIWASNVAMLWMQSKTEAGLAQLHANPPDWWTDEGLQRTASEVITLQPKLFGSHLMFAEVLNCECIERPGQPRWSITRERTSADYRRAAKAYEEVIRLSMESPASQARPLGSQEPVACIHHRLQQNADKMNGRAEELESLPQDQQPMVQP